MNKIQQQALALLVGTALTAPVVAAPTMPDAGPQDPQAMEAPAQGAPAQGAPADQGAQDFNQLLTELNRLEQRLASIQRDAIVENPSLRTQARELQGMLVDTMQEEGYAPSEHLQRIQEIQNQLSQPDLDPAQRQELIAEAQREQQQLSEAEQAAMEHEEIQQAAQAFETRLVDAMKEQDPNAERLLEEYESRSQELQAMLEQQPGAMQGQQPGAMQGQGQ